jgi:hypothetical protein
MNDVREICSPQGLESQARTLPGQVVLVLQGGGALGSYETHTKDIDFSRGGIAKRWDAGYVHTKAVLERSPWIGEFDPLSGVILHKQTEILPKAAE